MTQIALLHSHFDADHLIAVAAEMQLRGSPVIRVIDAGETLYALEGSHRLRAAAQLGVSVTLDHIDYDGTIDLDTLDYDDCGWFEDRSAVLVGDLFGRMYPMGLADHFVQVEVS